jgi:very-short-patch-repair endonuclease
MASETARRLRAEMTDAERKLWSLLRRKQLQGFRFRRQIPVGRYVAHLLGLDPSRLASLAPQDEAKPKIASSS